LYCFVIETAIGVYSIRFCLILGSDIWRRTIIITIGFLLLSDLNNSNVSEIDIIKTPNPEKTAAVIQTTESTPAFHGYHMELINVSESSKEIATPMALKIENILKGSTGLVIFEINPTIVVTPARTTGKIIL